MIFNNLHEVIIILILFLFILLPFVINYSNSYKIIHRNESLFKREESQYVKFRFCLLSFNPHNFAKYILQMDIAWEMASNLHNRCDKARTPDHVCLNSKAHASPHNNALQKEVDVSMAWKIKQIVCLGNIYSCDTNKL